MVSLGSLSVGLFLSFALSGLSFASDQCEGLVIRQLAQPGARPGQDILYVIDVYHSGDCDISGLEIEDYIPQGTQWIAAVPRPDEIPESLREAPDPWPVSKLRWRNRSIRPGQAINLQVTIRVPEMKSGWLRNTICLSAPNVVRRCGEIETFIRGN